MCLKNIVLSLGTRGLNMLEKFTLRMKRMCWDGIPMMIILTLILDQIVTVGKQADVTGNMYLQKYALDQISEEIWPVALQERGEGRGGGGADKPQS